MKKFRGREVIGWKTVVETEEDFDDVVNDFMERFDFEDYQFASCVLDDRVYLCASMLLRSKE